MYLIDEQDYPAIRAMLDALDTYPRKLGECIEVAPGRSYLQVPTSLGKKQIMARTAAWICHFGPIEHGKLIKMTCNSPFCINPAHMARCASLAKARGFNSREET